MNSLRRRVSGPPALAAICCLAVLASSCGNNGNETVGNETTAGTAVSHPSVTATTPATIVVAEAYTAPPDIPRWDDNPDVTTDQAAGFEVEVLGMAMIGRGEFVRLTATTAEPSGGEPSGGEPSSGEDLEDECSAGWLGFRFEDGEIHRYQELGTVGFARLFNGPRGQDAIVISCEESTERVLIQGSAIVPGTGVPELTEFEIGQPHLLDFDADFGWRGDLFGGYGWHGGWDELIYFDTETGFVTEANLMLGTRLERLLSGFDFVLPNDWELRQADPGDGAVEMWANDQSAWISILPVEWTGDPEFPEGSEPDELLGATAGLWEYVSVDRARLIGFQDRPTWIAETEDGTLRVMHLEAGANDLIIEAFVDTTLASSATAAVVDAAIELIRSYEAAG